MGYILDQLVFYLVQKADLYLPSNYTTLVSVGQNVIGGETIISNPNNISKITNTLNI